MDGWRQVRVKNVGNVLCFEVTRCSFVPFDEDTAVAGAMSVASATNVEIPAGSFGAVPNPNQASPTGYLIKIQTPCHNAMINKWSLGRLARRDERVVMVWVAQGRTDRAVLDGRRLELIEHGHSSYECAGESTVVRLCWRFFVSLDDPLADQQRESVIRLFLDVLSGSFREHHAHLTTRLETTLLGKHQ